MVRTALALAALTAALALPATVLARGIEYRLPAGWTADELYARDDPGKLESVVFADPTGEERILLLVLTNMSVVEGQDCVAIIEGMARSSCDRASAELVDVGGSTAASEIVACSEDGQGAIMEVVKARIGGAWLDIRFVSETRADHDADRGTFRGLLRGIEVLAI